MAVPTVTSFIPAVDGNSTFKIPGSVFISAAAVLATGSLIPRTLPDRFSDVINIKDYALNDGSSQETGIAAFITRLAATYTHGISPNISATSRAGYIPGGIFDADAITAGNFATGQSYTIITIGTTDFQDIGSPANVVGVNFTATGPGTGTGTARLLIRSNAFGYTVQGDGPASQLRDINIEIDHNRSSVHNLRLISSGSPIGTGVDLQAGSGFVFNTDISGKAIGIANNTGFQPGSFAAGNTVIGGWLRSNTVGVHSAQNNLTLAFMQITDFTEAGVKYTDQGGVHYIRNVISGDSGPALLMSGKSFSFTGTTVADSPTVSNISNFNGISLNDVIGSGVAGSIFAWNTRITAINEGAGTITVAPPATSTQAAPVTIVISQVPIESFFVDNSIGNAASDLHRVFFDIDSIATANGGDSILVTFTAPHYGLCLGEAQGRIDNTGVPAYDDAVVNSTYIEEIPDWFSIVLNIPFVSNQVTPGTVSFLDASFVVNSEGANGFVRNHFFLGNNMNGTILRGGANLNFALTRLKTKIFMDGVRPFRADATNGSAQLLNVSIPTSEIRLGLPLTAAGFAKGTVVASIDGPSTITLSNSATATNLSHLFTSPYQPNNILHLAPVDEQHVTEVGPTTPGGPGSLVGWAQFSMFPLGGATNVASEGTYFAGMRVPYTMGGFPNDLGSPLLNELGVTNTAVHMRSNNIRYTIQGANWNVQSGLINFRVNNTDTIGKIYNANGGDMTITTTAYRSIDPGAAYGSAIHLWKAPLGSTPFGETDDGGAFAVLPGNPLDNTVHFMLGASPNVMNLSGDYTTIQALPNVLDIRGIPQMSGYAAGAEYFRLSGAQATAGNSFIREDGDFSKTFYVANDSNGAAAGAQIGVRNQANAVTTAVRMQVFGTGFTTAGIFVQDGGAVYSDTALSGGLSVAALAGDLRIEAADNIIMNGLPTADPGIPGAAWRDAGAANVLKISP